MNPSLRHSTKRIDGLALSALLLLMCLVGAACSPGKSDAGSSGRPPAMAEIPQTFFYRIEADFILKETGEPIRFDYVVGCGGYVWNYSYTTSSKVSVRHPSYMYQAVPGGGALGMITIDMCGGWKWGNVRNVVDSPWAGKPHIPETVRPTVIWFDDANDLSHGWGYLTDDAYESPRAKIEFAKARITKSSKDDWEVWRNEAAANYEQVGMIPGPWGYTSEALTIEEGAELDLRGAGKGITTALCSAASRVKLEPGVVDEFFDLAPKETGGYWIPKPGEAGFEKSGTLINNAKLADQANLGLKNFVSPGNSIYKFGSLSGENLALVHPYSSVEYEGMAYREVYPLLPISATMGNDFEEPQKQYFRELLSSTEYKGFGYCYAPQKPIDLLPSLAQQFDPDAYKKPVFLFMRGEEFPIEDFWLSVGNHRASWMISRDGYLYFGYN